MFKNGLFWLGMGVCGVITAAATVVVGGLATPPPVIRGGFDEELPVAPEVAEEPVVDPLRPVHLVLLGHGGAGHAGGGLADTIIVAQIIPRQLQVNLFSIPRDLWVELPLGRTAESSELMHAKINTTLAIGNSERQYTWRPAQYQGKHGGGQLVKAVVGQVIGQPIDYYVAVDFSGFVKVIELVAGSQGLKVDVPYSFVDEFYPIEGKEDDPCDFSEEEIAALTAELSGYELEQQFICRYERLEFHQGPQLIAPEQLLKFVRSRHSGTNGGDFGRSQRQQVVIEALKKKVWSLSMIPKIPELLVQIFKLVRTDLDVDLVKKILVDYGDITDFQIASYVISNANYLQDGRSSDGQYILRPRAGEDDYTQIQELVRQTLEATAEASVV